MAPEPGRPSLFPGKVASVWEQDKPAGSSRCLEVPLLGKCRGRGASLPLWHLPHSCTLWYGETGGFAESWTAAVTELSLRTAFPTNCSLPGFKMDGFWVPGTGALFPALYLIRGPWELACRSSVLLLSGCGAVDLSLWAPISCSLEVSFWKCLRGWCVF